MTNAPNALIVDDNFYNRDLCSLALTHLGITHVEAENGKEALELLEEQPFNLLLLDLAMPELDGRTLVHQITDMGLRELLTVVIITAHYHLANDIEDMVDFVMYKPIDIQQFTQFIGRLQFT